MKKTIGISLACVCAAPVLTGCSSFAPAPSSSLRVDPVMQVTHSDNSATGLYALGRYYQGQNRLELAEQAFRKALAQNIDYVDAHSALGAVYAQQGKFDDAIAEYAAVLRSAPNLAQIYNNLGYTYYLQGNHEAAIAALDKATRLDPDNARAFNNLGAAYEKLGRRSEAASAYARATQQRAPKALASAPQEPERIETQEPAPVPTFDPDPPTRTAALPDTRRNTRPAPRPFRFQIANGNGTPALAQRFRDVLVSEGLPKPRLANLKPYRQKQTVVQYRAGFEEEAQRVSRRFANPPALVRTELPSGMAIDVRLVLGHDLPSRAASRQAQNEEASLDGQPNG
ncbi:tetratricopeptide repeat protein [Herbaspirillum sp. HC18]|nr:tetratricopeptide repeat protein [Herbaspirillum sp. HC18]